MLRVPRDVDSLLCTQHPSSHRKPFKGCSNPAVAGISAAGLLLLPCRPSQEWNHVREMLELQQPGFAPCRLVGKHVPHEAAFAGRAAWGRNVSSAACWGGEAQKAAFFFAECSLKTIQALLLKPQQQWLGSFQCRNFKRAVSAQAQGSLHLYLRG